jgi:hypothetical protein
VGVAPAGAWKYAFIYDLVTRHYPDLAEQARPIQRGAAQRKLAELYFESVGAAQARDLSRVFGWKAAEADKIMAGLEQAGRLRTGLTLAGQAGAWAALPALA